MLITKGSDSADFVQKNISAIEAAFRLRKSYALEQALLLASKYKPGSGERVWLEDVIHHELRTWTPLADDLGPTPETAASPSARDPVLEAALREIITDEEFRAARMIASIVEEVCASVMPRARQLGMGRASGGSADRISHWASIRYSAAYRPWAKRLGPVGVQPVLAFAVHGLGLYAVARRHRRAYRPMVDYIRANLRLFAQLYREADLGLMGFSLTLAMEGPMGGVHVPRAPGKIGRKGKGAGRASGPL